MTEHRDLVVIGAGWAGIAAAKIYLDLHPRGNLLVLDANSAIGGTWAPGNIYPRLKTQNTLGSFEYSWYPLSTEEFGVQAGEHIPGHVVQRYLARVAEVFNLQSRIRFHVRVLSAEPQTGGGWLLRGQAYDGPQEFLCDKLIIATGVTSIPSSVKIEDRDKFRGTVIEYKDLSKPEGSSLLKDPAIDTVTVIGGSKSGHDAVFWSAAAGKRVHWIVQQSGHGIAWMTSVSGKFLGRKLQVERMATTRCFSLFSPCIWGNADGHTWIRWLLHKTRPGRQVVQSFWGALGKMILSSTGLDVPGNIETAKPDFGFQWQASSAGTLNYDGDFYSHIRSGRVTIHRKNLDRLGDDRVLLADGGQLPTDALIYCPGWKWTCPIKFTNTSSLDLGVPSVMDQSSEIDKWIENCMQADQKIQSGLPYVMQAPPGPTRATLNAFGAYEDGVAHTSWCLYRSIAPPSQAFGSSKRDIAFLGCFGTLPKAAMCEIQALWAVAFLHDQVDLPPTPEEAKSEAMLWTRWARLRYPYSHASKFMDTSYDVIPYFDVLLSDMGLRCRRKRNWWRELTEPYDTADYKGLVDEFRELNC
ncbi:hypothetical protein BST61_g9464 [Cercospora zeina]